MNSKFLLKNLMGLGLALLLLNACNKSGPANQASDSQVSNEFGDPIAFDFDKIKERGSIRGIVDYSSTSYFIYKGQPMGYEYELLKRLSDYLNLELELVVTTNIDEALKKLNNGEGDVLAYSFTVTKERSKIVLFTKNHYTVRQILVQRKPDNWRNMKLHEIEKALIRDQVDLIGKEITVRSSSSYVDRLEHLSHEIGGDIEIIEDTTNAETEALIKRVAQGEIKYTIADEDIALVNATYYPDIDIKTPISFPQQIAWAVRKNSSQLKDTLDWWISNLKKGPVYNIIYNKYFKNLKRTKLRSQSEYASFSGDKISPYDDIIKEVTDTLGWDWRLIVSQVYQESKFDPEIISWAGAVGLMQILPSTGNRFGASNLLDPKQNIMAGIRYMNYLDNIWKDRIPDVNDRLKYVLASYNVGTGHVIDARQLAEKYGDDPDSWEDVEYYLLKKSIPKYFNDPVVQFGYCRGEEPVNYVKEIINRYQQYIQLINS